MPKPLAPKLPAAIAQQVGAHRAQSRKRPSRPQRPEPASPPAKKRKLPELKLPKKDRAGDAEDGEIEWLEYMLRREKNKDPDGLDDGLDDLLDFADTIGPGGGGFGSDEDRSEGDEDEGEEEDEDEDEDDEEDDEEDDGEDEHDEDDEEVPSDRQDPHAQDTPPDDPAPATTKYIPPALRAAQLAAKSQGDASKAEARVKLERKAQGLLNKLGESNLEAIIGELEGLYRDHSRHDTTTTITNLVIQMISDKANLLDSFVVLYATAIGALHRIIGIEFGAHFTHTVVMRYQGLVSGAIASSIKDSLYETGSKESMNLLTLIAELFNAGVISSRLIYDLVRGFLEAPAPEGEVMGEQEVEGLLRVMKRCGPQLRSEDPASLKDIVSLVLAKTKGKEKDMTTRARFMIETLVNLKGGKVKPTDATERTKKYLASLSRKHRVEPLRISLADLVAADSRGKWWLVGAGWAGNPIVERQQAKAKQKAAPKVEEELLLEAARKQGMNTDVRRSIFVVLMTSEDYVHACERLSQFKLSEVQQRECVRVALHCVGSEKVYNPYHTLVLNQLCALSYAHRFTLQYALWDFLREIDTSKTDARVGHVARAMAYIVARGSLDLTVFKAVDFTSLRSPATAFFATFIPCLILGTQTVSPLFTLPKGLLVDDVAIDDAFEKALANGELAQGLAYIMGKTRKVALADGNKVVERGWKRAKAVLARAI